MQLQFSFIARERAFAKAMRRINPRFQPLLDAFEATALHDSSHREILVDITDDQGCEFFEEIPNNDGFFQVVAGCSQWQSDDELAQEVFDILRRTILAYRFGSEDREKLDALFRRFAPDANTTP